MSIFTGKLLKIIENIAPLDIAENWDNCGMQIDCGKEKVDKILISLEITDKVIDEAISHNVDFIITHHPLIFEALKNINNNDITGGYIFKLIQNGISVYSAHTSFDSANGGNNDYLFSLLELTKLRRMNPVHGIGKENAAMCRIGEFIEPMNLKQVCKLVEEKLKIKTKVRAVGQGNKTIRTVGLCTGAGGEFLEAAKKMSCDLFITGDLKHHQALWAKESELCVIDAGHYGTEWIFTPNMAKLLRKNGLDIEIIESQIITDPFF